LAWTAGRQRDRDHDSSGEGGASAESGKEKASPARQRSMTQRVDTFGKMSKLLARFPGLRHLAEAARAR
jgi:hypothetical protein